MSFPESEISDILEKADAEELYNNVHEIVNYVDESTFGNDLHSTVPETFRNLDVESSMELKHELLFENFSLPPESLLNQPSHQLQANVPISICNEEYAGPHNFDVSIIPDGSKNPWVYSPLLNKVFINMGTHFPVDFRVVNRPQDTLYVRVMPSYSSLQHSQELVHRCVQHQQPQLNKNIPEHVRQHIIRVLSNGNATYLGDRHLNQRLSIVFPLAHPQTGTDAVREMFVFTCKNSCPTGMNRRPLEIIFTLERFDGEILGRRILNVRICSCPKRDKEKDEKDWDSRGTAPQGKKRKLDNSKVEKKPVIPEDTTVHSLTIEVPGKHNIQQILKYCQDLMSGEIMRNPQNNETFMCCYKKIQAQMSQLQH